MRVRRARRRRRHRRSMRWLRPSRMRARPGWRFSPGSTLILPPSACRRYHPKRIAERLMNDNLPENIAGALGTGLPVLLLQFVICIVLLIVGVAIYTMVTPFRERELLRQGNVAAATV